MTIKLVNSKDYGEKTKVIPPATLYVSCNKGTPLQNKFEFRTDIPTEKKIDMFKESGLPLDKIRELYEFAIKKKVKVLLIGENTYPIKSHSSIIAEEISPSGDPFHLDLKSNRGEPVFFENQREFCRRLEVTNRTYRKHMVSKFLDKFSKDEILIDIECLEDK